MKDLLQSIGIEKKNGMENIHMYDVSYIKSLKINKCCEFANNKRLDLHKEQFSV